MLQTPLHAAHLAAGARMVDFSGWDMPINYGSQIEEHRAVRTHAGMFDVSHMAVIDLAGEQCRPFLSYLLANDIARLQEPGKALYSCMLNENGGVIDDLICYFLGETRFRLVVNAGTRDKDLTWIGQHAGRFSVQVKPRPELAMIAVQGPNARTLANRMLDSAVASVAGELQPFFALEAGDFFVARTGYTGEDGYEMTLPGDRAEEVWNQLVEAGVKPCGLGARDTLRLEAGMNLYGQDMDESVTPLESALSWTVAMKDDRLFIGREALAAQKQSGLKRKLVGLVLQDRGVLRAGQVVRVDEGEGVTTSGGFAPTLERAIAFARIPVGESRECTVDVRGKLLAARIVKPPFVRNGKACDGVL